MLSLNSTSANRRLYRSTPLAHCAVAGCLLFSIHQGNSMSHRGYRGWGRFPYSKMTTVSRKFRCIKCTSISVLVDACTGHPSTGQLRGPPLDGKSMRYVRGSSPVAEAFELSISSAARTCCVILFPAKYPAAISSSHSLNCTRTLCRYRYEGPSPIIRCL